MQQPRGAEPWPTIRGWTNCSMRSATPGVLRKRFAAIAPSCCRRFAVRLQLCIVEAQLDELFPEARSDPVSGGGSGGCLGSSGGRGHRPRRDGRSGSPDG